MVAVHVIYCGGWGYGSKVRTLEQYLKDNCSVAIEFTSESTKGTTGYLEVSVDGTLVHSKKDGDGYVDTQEKKNKIVEAIKAAATK